MQKPLTSVVPNAPRPLPNNPPPEPRPIILAGPTGVGKSAFAVRLAEHLNGEIVGADAFQIYRSLPILTAQPVKELLERVPHHLTGCLDPRDSLDAARYVRLAGSVIADIQSRGRIPIVTGGTGLYLKALTHGLQSLPPPDPALRERIRTLSLPEALRELENIDPRAPATIDIRNPVRVHRALEIVLQSGRPLAESRTTWQNENGRFTGFVLTRPRAELHARIALNVDALFALGVVEEVRASHGQIGPSAARAIGYTDILDFLAGRIDQPGCRNRILHATRQYARRQETWCRSQWTFPAVDVSRKNALEEVLKRLTAEAADRR